MRDVNYGWLLRYMHSNGASMFFIAVYMHIFRGLLLRLVQGAARGALAARHRDLSADDGDGFPRLHAAVGPDVVLGCHRHHELLLSAIPAHRREHHANGCGARLRSTTRRCNGSSQPALSAAVRDRGRRGAAHLGAARAGQQQSARHRREGAARHGAVPSRITRRRTGSGSSCSADRSRYFIFFNPNFDGARRQLCAGQPAGDAGAHRAGMVLPAALRDLAVGAGQADRASS